MTNTAKKIAFKNHPVPVLGGNSINTTTQDLGGYHISYNPSSADYGSPTTAIVLQHRVFFILNGDHSRDLAAAVERDGIQGAMGYFIDNVALANPRSEHPMVTGESSDPFGLIPTAIEVLGQSVIDQLARACRSISSDSLSTDAGATPQRG